MRPKRSARVHRRIRAEFATRGQKPRLGFTANLSETGMFLAAGSPYPVGALVTVKLLLDEPVELSTVVVHSRKGIAGATTAVQSGMGLRFLNAPSALGAVLDPKSAAAREPGGGAEEKRSADSPDAATHERGAPSPESGSVPSDPPDEKPPPAPAPADDGSTHSNSPEADRSDPARDESENSPRRGDLSAKLVETEREVRRLEQMLEDDEREKAMLRGLVSDLEKNQRDEAEEAAVAQSSGAELDELRSKLDTAKGENVRLRARVTALEASLAETESAAAAAVAKGAQPESRTWGRLTLFLVGAIAVGVLGALILAVVLKPEQTAVEVELPDGSAPATVSSTVPSPPSQPPAQAEARPDSGAEPQPEESDPVEPEAAAVEETTPEPAEEVEAAVKAWARAWSDQRVEDYLAAYSVGFEPADGSSLSDWRQLRRTRIARPSSVRVTLERVSVRFPSEGVATAVFVQSYETPTYQDRVRKRLRLVDEGGVWLITQEEAEELP